MEDRNSEKTHVRIFSRTDEVVARYSYDLIWDYADEDIGRIRH